MGRLLLQQLMQMLPPMLRHTAQFRACLQGSKVSVIVFDFISATDSARQRVAAASYMPCVEQLQPGIKWHPPFAPRSILAASVLLFKAMIVSIVAMFAVDALILEAPTLPSQGLGVRVRRT
jgi:hypothetical protein